jgi:hypothetical protein
MASGSQSARQVSADAGRGSGYERNSHDAFVDSPGRQRKAVLGSHLGAGWIAGARMSGLHFCISHRYHSG